jgi:S-adenosylmethionine:tRNA ribosyltransferase-isomerase
MKEIDINDYDYDLPEERIAQYPVNVRDASQLLISSGDRMSVDLFRNIDDYLPAESLLVFNNTRVIRARILFLKATGARIELLCLEPVMPHEYELSLGSLEPVEWKCIIGNLKKWKSGILTTPFIHDDNECNLIAERLRPVGDAWIIRLSWNCETISFGEVIEAAGHIPLPPYISRPDEPEDNYRYQTVYSSVRGSVAAPTAGLHFTKEVLKRIGSKGIRSAEVTLHVGAGTFQPVKTRNISDHEMHCEHFYVSAETIELIQKYHGKIIPVGTTSVRTLESLYWIGVKISQDTSLSVAEFVLDQWEPYKIETGISVMESMEFILQYMKKRADSTLHVSTSIIIVPGYDFKMISGIITNFHQPRSTLLLLISAWTGKNWKKIYRFAIKNKFRFLSFGDSSLLFRQ